MARPKLRSPDQPAPVRLLAGLFESLASLRLAVVVIAASAIVLGWATVVESKYGTPAVHFGIYDTLWFALLMLLLGINVLCAALVRFPWKKYQTGFVITHGGILVLLVGCLFSRLGGIDAQLPVFEGQTGHLAYEDTQHFALKVSNVAAEPQRIQVPFASGPFNWDDYRSLFPFPWRFSHRDGGLVYDRDGVRLEVLDYYADSRLRPAGPLELHVRAPAGQDGTKQRQSGDPAWQTIELDVMMPRRGMTPHGMGVVGSQEKLSSGEAISYWVAGSRAETQAFLESQPEGPLGELGQVVVHAGGTKFPLAVERLQDKRPVPLGSTGITLRLVSASSLGLELNVAHPDGETARMLLFADSPEFNLVDRDHAVFATYWAPPTAGSSAEPSESPGSAEFPRSQYPRIDVIQGADGKLYYRTWRSPQVEKIAEVPLGGAKVVAFPEGSSPVSFYVQDVAPHDLPGWRVEPVAFEAKKDKGLKTRRARVRLTVDGNSEEFWLQGLGMKVLPLPEDPDQRHVVLGEDRRVTITMPWDTIDVGVNIYLHNFQRKLDPGTSQASHYSSLVDLRDRGDPDRVLEGGDELLVNLNQPENFSDPGSGRSYRLYQEAFRGPYKPGDEVYHLVMEGRPPRDQLFMSILTVNYDPGRGLKYFGSLMIVAGIATMFYMRAYFFRARPSSEQETPPPRPEQAKARRVQQSKATKKIKSAQDAGVH